MYVHMYECTFVCMYVCVYIHIIISGELIVSKYVAESITMIAGRFGHERLCQLRTKLRNVLQSLLLILLRICSRSVRQSVNKVAMSLYNVIIISVLMLLQCIVRILHFYLLETNVSLR